MIEKVLDKQDFGVNLFEEDFDSLLIKKDFGEFKR